MPEQGTLKTMPEPNKEVNDALDSKTLEKEVIEEMEAEKTEDKSNDKPDKDESIDESQKEEEKKEKPDEKDNKEEDKKDDKDKDDKNDKDENDELPIRTAKTMPIWKHRIAEKKWSKELDESRETTSNLQKKITEFKNVSTPDQDKLVKEVADETGLDEGVIKKLGKIFNQKSEPSLSDKDKQRISELEEVVQQSKESNLFDKEYTRDVIPLMDKMSDDAKAKAKNLLHDLAFTEEFAKVPLKRIFRFEEFDDLKLSEPKKGKKSAEPSSSGARGKITDYSDIKSEDILGENQMPDKDFDKLLEKVKGGRQGWDLQDSKL